MVVMPLFLRRLRVQVYPFLDDWLVKGQSRAQVVSNIRLTQSTFKVLGLLINAEKSTPILVQRIEFTGTVFNSTQARVYLSEVRLKSIRSPITQRSSNYNSPELHEAFRSHGLMHIGDTTSKTAPQSPPDMAGLSIFSKQSPFGHCAHGTSMGSNLPQLVVGYAHGLCGRSLYMPSTVNDPGLRHVSARVGSSPGAIRT